VADADGNIFGNYKPGQDTSANHNAAVPVTGLMVFKTGINQVAVGNNALYGGIPISLESESCLFVSADGTTAKNGQALSDRIAEAGTRTPYGSALSLTNWANVLVGPGDLDITGLAAGITIPNFVRIIGLGGSDATRIITSTTRRFLITNADGVVFYSAMSGLQFVPSAAGASLTTSFAGGGTPTINLAWYDINFPGLSAAQSCMNIGSLTGLANPTFAGEVRRVRTTGMGLLGGHTNAPTTGNLTLSCKFYDCEAGDRSFGGSSTTIGTRDGLLTGGLYRCKNNGTGANAFSAKVNCEMFDCDWKPAIQRVGSSAFFLRNIVREAISSESIEHDEAVTCRLAFNVTASPIGSNITNSIDDGTLDTAGNFSDADMT
jgi:hypothetical protein